MNEHKFMIIGAVAAAAVLLILVKKKGAATDAGAAIGGAAVDLAGGVITGAVTGISKAVGIPTPAETIQNADECQRYADTYGTFAASQKCGLPAFFGISTDGSKAVTPTAINSTQNPMNTSSIYPTSTQPGDAMLYGSD